jgi:uncharacterized protein YndB with AHSA1/START domain
MFHVVESIELERPADAVFELIANLERMPEWIGSCVGTRVEDPGAIGLGTRFTATSKFMSSSFDFPFVITEYAPPRTLAMQAREGGRFMVVNRAEVTPTAAGTRVTAIFTGDTAGFYKLAEPVLVRGFRRSVRQNLIGLKRILEAEVGVTR